MLDKIGIVTKGRQQQQEKGEWTEEFKKGWKQKETLLFGKYTLEHTEMEMKEKILEEYLESNFEMKLENSKENIQNYNVFQGEDGILFEKYAHTVSFYPKYWEKDFECFVNTEEKMFDFEELPKKEKLQHLFSTEADKNKAKKEKIKQLVREALLQKKAATYFWDELPLELLNLSQELSEELKQKGKQERIQKQFDLHRKILNGEKFSEWDLWEKGIRLQ